MDLRQYDQIKPTIKLINILLPGIDPEEVFSVTMVEDEVGHEQVGHVVLVGGAFEAFLNNKTWNSKYFYIRTEKD